MELFEQVFIFTSGRIIKPDAGANMKLKQKGTAVPTLEKAQSRIDENVSEVLIGQAFEIMFREFERYIKIMKSYKGVDWGVYVKTRNKERKNNESKKEYHDEKLFDEEETEKKEDEPKKEDAEPKKEDEESKKEEGAAQEENKVEDKKEEESTAEASTLAPDSVSESEV
jgi:hypothetical protein